MREFQAVEDYAFAMGCNKLVFLSLLPFLALACSAQTSRNGESKCDATSASGVEITPGDAKILGFSLGRSTLKDVLAKLGPAKVIRVSREEESDSRICYLSPSDGTVLIFYTGVMGGGEDITSFAIWSREAGFPHSSECSSSQLVSRTLSTASGLRIGLTRTEFNKIAGQPTQAKPDFDGHDFLCRRKMTEAEISGFKTANGWDVTKDPYFDRTSWIRAWYRRSRSSRIEIGEIESY